MCLALYSRLGRRWIVGSGRCGLSGGRHPDRPLEGQRSAGPAVWKPRFARLSLAAPSHQTPLTSSEREQAQEGQYIRDLEKEKLRKLKEKADAANKEVEAQKARMAQNGDKDH